MFFKTSLPMALDDGIERFDFHGCTFVSSVECQEGRAFIERTTAADQYTNFTM